MTDIENEARPTIRQPDKKEVVMKIMAGSAEMTGNMVNVVVVQNDEAVLSPMEWTRVLRIIQGPAKKSRVMEWAMRRARARTKKDEAPK